MSIASMSDSPAGWVLDAREQARNKILALAERSGDAFFHATEDGRYPSEPAAYWTSGFWPGLLRLVLNEGRLPEIEALALRLEDRLFDMVRTEEFLELHHDVGFQFHPTSVMRHRQTGDADARRRGLVAAHLLMGRFNAASGVIEAWNGDDRRGFSIIDTAMNLALLFWATETSGEPRFANLARAHLATMEREFVRDDFSTHHIIEFDQVGGQRKAAHGGQGFAPESAWSRGTAWAVYGLAIAARYTGESHYRALSQKIADRFIALNDGFDVPPWDFRTGDVATAPLDSSAAAIMACGLLELAAQGAGERADQADGFLTSLIARCATFDDPKHDALLKHATSNLPAEIAIDQSLIYGDYFFYEALQRRSGVTPVCW